MAFLARDGVEAPVRAVDEVHVRDARRTVQMPRPLRPTRHRVTGRIIGAEVSLGLDDPACGGAVGRRALQDATEQVAGDLLGWTVVERRRESSPACAGHPSTAA